MLRLFGMEWVMSGSVAELLFCWYHWLGKHSSDIWDLVLGCLLWTIGLNGIIGLLRMRRKRWFSY